MDEKEHPVVPKRKVDVTIHEDRPVAPGATFHPPVDIYETVEEMVILADMPGVDPEKLHLHVRGDELIITGEVTTEEAKEERVLYREYEVGHWHRHFFLPDHLDREKLSAAIAHGVLTLTLPKKAEVQPKRIVVKTT